MATLLLAAVGLSAFLLSGIAARGTYARYTTSATRRDAAQVARFAVSAAPAPGQATALTLSADAREATYIFTVTGQSEVAVVCDAVVTLPAPLPAGLSLTLDGQAGEPDATGKSYTFSAISTLAAGGGTTTHTLTVSASDAALSADATLQGISVRVIARQIQ